MLHCCYTNTRGICHLCRPQSDHKTQMCCQKKQVGFIFCVLEKTAPKVWMKSDTQILEFFYLLDRGQPSDADRQVPFKVIFSLERTHVSQTIIPTRLIIVLTDSTVIHTIILKRYNKFYLIIFVFKSEFKCTAFRYTIPLLISAS